MPRYQTFKEWALEDGKPIAQPEFPVVTPSQLDRPVFCLNYPLTLSTTYANNEWMREIPAAERKVKYDEAFKQFNELYSFMVSQGAVVYLLPNEGTFQDQVYVANLGCYLPHLKDKNVILLSNYKSPPRKGEDYVGEQFFGMMKYQTHRPATTWEGEADLKYLRDNIYIGGYGIRTNLASYRWMQDRFDMKIVPVRMTDEKLYHFDTLFLRLAPEKVMMPVSVLDRADISAVEVHAEVIDVPVEVVETGCFNSVRCGKYLMGVDPKYVMDLRSKDKSLTRKVYAWLDKVSSLSGLTPKLFNLFEFQKSGADLGCLVFHLNYHGF